ncbi:MAG: ATP phosphoribosyltransferase regulatory subunit [Pseudonocardiaceae bacterium]
MTENGRHLDLPRGFHDTSPDRMAMYLTLQQEWFDTCGLAGYQPVQVPPVGFTDTFTVGHHAAGQKLYRFPDRRGRDLTLISDSLPALLRVTHARNLPEQRLSYCCPIFRYERRPRRHFHHLGLIEVLDRPNSLAEQRRSTARLAETIIRFLTPLLPVVFIVTDPGLWHTIAETLLPSRKTTEFLNSVRRLLPNERPAQLRQQDAPPPFVHLAERLTTNPALLDDPGDHLTIDGLPQAVHDRISACHELATVLRHHGADATVDLGELHASEFHDGPSLLFRPRGERRLLGDGGSYGLFADAFLGAATAVHSAVVGLERLADIITTTESTRPAADIAILTHPEQATVIHADQLTTSLRSAGIAVWDLVLTKSLRQHLRDLSGLAIPYSILIGAQELNAHEYTIRNSDGIHYAVTSHRLVQWILDRRPARPHGHTGGREP